MPADDDRQDFDERAMRASSHMLRAIIFDFNGVLIDDEPLHFLAFREALAREGIRLRKRDYFDRYLALDDRTLARQVLLHQGFAAPLSRVARIRRIKEETYQELLKTRLHIFPGAGVFVRRCASRFPLAIASGALRSEIRFILNQFKLAEFFEVIVSADDVDHGKPHTETFLKALRGLNQRQPRGWRKILPEECLVIEDSVHGIDSAHEAGMKCLAVAHSYPWARIRKADWRAKHIRDLRLRDIESKFDRG